MGIGPQIILNGYEEQTMKYLLTTVAAACLTATVASAEYNAMNPITVDDIENRIADITNMQHTLDVTNLEKMVDYMSTDVDHHLVEEGSLSFGDKVELTFPEIDTRTYAQLSFDPDAFATARADFIKDVHQFFVASDDGTINFINYNTNEGILGIAANNIVNVWDAMNVHVSNLQNDPTNSSHWTSFQAEAEKIPALETIYNELHKTYIEFAEDVIAWDQEDLVEYHSDVNTAAMVEALK